MTMTERISIADYRKIINTKVGPAFAKANARTASVLPETGSRISLSEYASLRAGKGARFAGGVTGPCQATKPKKLSPAEKAVQDLKHATISGECIPGESLSIKWHGVRLLTLNELLRIDHRQLTAYRHACHQAAASALWAIEGAYGFALRCPVTIHLNRVGRRLVDKDGMYASYKFMIDGFRHCGVIVEDDPTILVGITDEQAIGKAPLIGMVIRAAVLGSCAGEG